MDNHSGDEIYAHNSWRYSSGQNEIHRNQKSLKATPLIKTVKACKEKWRSHIGKWKKADHPKLSSNTRQPQNGVRKDQGGN